MLLDAKGEPIRGGRIDLSPGALNYYPGDPGAEQRVRELRRSVLGDPVLTEHVVWRGELAVSSEKLQRMKHLKALFEASDDGEPDLIERLLSREADPPIFVEIGRAALVPGEV